jgi:SAM-dependent methyltransferase
MEPQTSTPAVSAPFELRERTCPTCGIEARRTLGLRGGDYHRYRLGMATRIVQCERCSLIFPNPFPYATRPAELYGDPDEVFGQMSPRALEIGRGTVREARALVSATQPSLLDVGCGRGHMLGAAKLEGLERVLGLEISASAAATADALYGVEVIDKTIEDFARSTDETFDIVMLSGVLEHVPDPDSMIASVRKLTHPGSIVYIDVPCEPSLITEVGNRINRLRGDQSVLNLSPTWPPYHVFGFNRRALQTLLSKHGFTLESLTIWAAPKIHAKGELKDRIRAAVGTQINRLANLLRMSNNMNGWARRR